MNQKKAKALRKVIGNWKEKWYDIIEHPLDPSKFLASLSKRITIKLNPLCGRALYQEAKKNG